MQLTKSKFVLATRGVQLDNEVISPWMKYVERSQFMSEISNGCDMHVGFQSKSFIMLGNLTIFYRAHDASLHLKPCEGALSSKS